MRKWNIKEIIELEGLLLLIFTGISLTIAFICYNEIGSRAMLYIGLICLSIYALMFITTLWEYDEELNFLYIVFKSIEKSMVIVAYMFFLIHMKEYMAGLIL